MSGQIQAYYSNNSSNGSFDSNPFSLDSNSDSIGMPPSTFQYPKLSVRTLNQHDTMPSRKENEPTVDYLINDSINILFDDSNSLYPFYTQIYQNFNESRTSHELTNLPEKSGNFSYDSNGFNYKQQENSPFESKQQQGADRSIGFGKAIRNAFMGGTQKSQDRSNSANTGRNDSKEPNQNSNRNNSINSQSSSELQSSQGQITGAIEVDNMGKPKSMQDIFKEIERQQEQLNKLNKKQRQQPGEQGANKGTKVNKKTLGKEKSNELQSPTANDVLNQGKKTKIGDFSLEQQSSAQSNDLVEEPAKTDLGIDGVSFNQTQGPTQKPQDGQEMDGMPRSKRDLGQHLVDSPVSNNMQQSPKKASFSFFGKSFKKAMFGGNKDKRKGHNPSNKDSFNSNSSRGSQSSNSIQYYDLNKGQQKQSHDYLMDEQEEKFSIEQEPRSSNEDDLYQKFDQSQQILKEQSEKGKKPQEKSKLEQINQQDQVIQEQIKLKFKNQPNNDIHKDINSLNQKHDQKLVQSKQQQPGSRQQFQKGEYSQSDDIENAEQMTDEEKQQQILKNSFTQAWQNVMSEKEKKQQEVNNKSTSQGQRTNPRIEPIQQQQQQPKKKVQESSQQQKQGKANTTQEKPEAINKQPQKGLQAQDLKNIGNQQNKILTPKNTNKSIQQQGQAQNQNSNNSTVGQLDNNKRGKQQNEPKNVQVGQNTESTDKVRQDLQNKKIVEDQIITSPKANILPVNQTKGSQEKDKDKDNCQVIYVNVETIKGDGKRVQEVMGWRAMSVQKMTEEELSMEKRSLKKLLRSLDDIFEEIHKKAPLKDDKKNLRPLYLRYWQIKRALKKREAQSAVKQGGQENKGGKSTKDKDKDKDNSDKDSDES